MAVTGSRKLVAAPTSMLVRMSQALLVYSPGLLGAWLQK